MCFLNGTGMEQEWNQKGTERNRKEHNWNQHATGREQEMRTFVEQNWNQHATGRNPHGLTPHIAGTVYVVELAAGKSYQSELSIMGLVWKAYDVVWGAKAC